MAKIQSPIYLNMRRKQSKTVTLNYFKIIRKGYKRSKFRRKLPESLHIKEKCFSSNTQETSLALKLFNQDSGL